MTLFSLVSKLQWVADNYGDCVVQVANGADILEHWNADSVRVSVEGGKQRVIIKGGKGNGC